MKSNITIEDKNKIGIYIIHNPTTDETYAGSGILNERLYEHSRHLENKNVNIKHHNFKLQKAYNKNSNFEFIGIPVEENNFTKKENRQLALELEQQMINEHKDNPLFLNIALDATAPMYGRKQTEEHITKRVIQLTGQKRNSEICEAISKRMKDNVPSLETREKNSISQKRFHESLSDEVKEIKYKNFIDAGHRAMQKPENRQKQSERMKDKKYALGNKHTDLFKQQKSLEMIGNNFALGHKHTEETKKELSSFHKKRYKDPEILKNISIKNKEIGLKPSKECHEASLLVTCKPCIIFGAYFKSTTDAGQAFNINRVTVTYRCDSNNFPDWNWV